MDEPFQFLENLQVPPWRLPRGKWMVSLVNSHTNATSKRWHLWEIDLRFALNSTPWWRVLRFGVWALRFGVLVLGLMWGSGCAV